VGSQIAHNDDIIWAQWGTSICSTQAKKHFLSIGPSSSIGAMKPASV
jgi:hypothetical protein